MVALKSLGETLIASTAVGVVSKVSWRDLQSQLIGSARCLYKQLANHFNQAVIRVVALICQAGQASFDRGNFVPYTTFALLNPLLYRVHASVAIGFGVAGYLGHFVL
jgi:hypothetical protein